MTLWVESEGGPLAVVPVSALSSWHGCTEAGVIVGDGASPDDYDRACAVDDLVGLLLVGPSQALVLADDPARTCYLAEDRAFLRWGCADSEADLLASAAATLADPGTTWAEFGTWITDGPAVMFDSAEAGIEDFDSVRAPVPLAAGRWRVRTVQVDEQRTSFTLVQLLPA
ncbi:MAG TPA: Imm21 family immunity protein [Kutzneria sp.]